MLVGGGLGFPYMVLATVLLIPVIGFAVRRKWRLAVARREEIKRLLVLAAEESARAEVEATAGYFPLTPPPVASKPQYQCAVCFCPTTTRCSQCRAVRYCSGKCQIIHWRHGHKDECRPFASLHQINDGGSLGPKVVNQEDVGIRCTEPVGEHVLNSSRHSEGLDEKDDVGGDPLSKGTAIDSTFNSKARALCDATPASSTSSLSSLGGSAAGSNDSDWSSGVQFSNAVPETIKTKTFLEHPGLVKSVKGVTITGDINQVKSLFYEKDAPSGLSSSSNFTDVGANESSFSEPSTLSGFWGGTIRSRRSAVDKPGDSALSGSSEAVEGSMPNSPLFRFKSRLGKPAVHSNNVKDSDANSVITNGNSPNLRGIKNPSVSVTFLEEKSKDGLNSILDMSKHKDRDAGGDPQAYLSSEVDRSISRPGHTHPTATGGGASMHGDSKTVTDFPSSASSTEKSKHFNNKGSTSLASKSLEVKSSVSKASDGHCASYASSHLAKGLKSIKNYDGPHEDVDSSSQSSETSQNSKNEFRTSITKVIDQLKPSKLSPNYPLQAGREMTGRYGWQGPFPYELFVNLYNWKKVELHPCGLINCGNSCYANAVLQCLAFTPPLTAYLLQGNHSKSCETNKWCFTCELESLVLKAKDGNAPLSPVRILSNLQNIGSHLGNGREEDAHEFLRYAIGTMQSFCLTKAGRKAVGSFEEETTLIGLTFGGYLRSKIKCMKCGGKSERHDRIMDLNVEIEGNISTLEQALYKFTDTEILDGENKYQCSRCKSYEKAKKKLTVSEAPNVLTIALKRFQSGKYGKLNKPIKFPEILDLAPYMSGTSDKSPIYRLYGVVVHLDTDNATFSGHYLCYVKNVQNQWFKIDDSTVMEVELQTVLSKSAYMLLYARCLPRAPRLIRNSLTVPRDAKKPKTPNSKPKPNPSGDNFRPNPMNNHFMSERAHQVLEEDSSSDHSSFFSESCSCSTDSSNKDSNSTDDYFDHIFGDLERDWNNMCVRNSSDSETSSCSSSPLYSKHDSYSSSSPFLSSKKCRIVGCSDCSCNCCSSSSPREVGSDRLGRVINPWENLAFGLSLGDQQVKDLIERRI